jgi:transcription antitermination factor NusA-like protein
MGKGVEGILATTEQSPLEHYRIGQNVKAYVLEVRRTPRGPALFVSRTHKGFLKRLFELEVPEIHNGTVEVRAIAREAGSRSKVAVASRQEGLDPVGATVGQRGARVQAVVAELGGEKIDVIPWNDDPSAFVANALSPAQVLSVDIDQEHRIANVTVPERMLSLAIGREGQNARLAARLTGWRIDIRSDVSVAEAKASDTRPADAAVDVPPAAGAAEEPAAADVEAVEAVAAGEDDAADVTAKPAKAATRKAATTKAATTKAATTKAATTTTKTTKPKAAKTDAADDDAAEPAAEPAAEADTEAPAEAAGELVAAGAATAAKPRARRTKATADDEVSS